MPTKERLHELFEYKAGHLYRRLSRGNTKAGERAGTRTRGYINVCADRHYTREHRLIWFMFRGPVPDGYEIDHINHLRDDNRLENLRLVSRAGNRRNASLSSNNTSGVCGVYFNKSLKLWCARINDNDGKTIMLGCRKDKDAAIALRRSGESKYGYHPNHGQAPRK